MVALTMKEKVKLEVIQSVMGGSIEIIYKTQTVARFKYESVLKIVKKCGFDENHITVAA